MDLFDLIGSAGVAIVIGTYLMLQLGRIRPESLAYSVLNASGAGLIAFSLIFKFNFAAFVVEVFWIMISLFGIYKNLTRKK